MEMLGKGTGSFLETVENAGSVQITPCILIYICIKVSYARMQNENFQNDA